MKLPSFGLKRYVASVLTAVAGVIASDPTLAPALPIITYLASFFGITGLAHAGAAGTLANYKLASFTSIFSLLISLCDAVPKLAHFKPILLVIGSFLGISTVALNDVPSLEKTE